MRRQSSAASGDRLLKGPSSPKRLGHAHTIVQEERAPRRREPRAATAPLDEEQPHQAEPFLPADQEARLR